MHPPTENRDGQQEDHKSVEEQQGDAETPVGLHERGSGKVSTKDK